MHSETFTNKIKTLEDNDKKVTYNYFTKFEAVEKLFDIALSKKKLIRGSFGNFNAKIVFVVNFNRTNDKIIKEIKKVCEKSNCDFYTTYITSIDKFEDKALDMKILKKELEIINPKRVVVLGENLQLKNCKCLDRKYLEAFNNDDKDLLKEANKEFLSCMSYAFFGG